MVFSVSVFAFEQAYGTTLLDVCLHLKASHCLSFKTGKKKKTMCAKTGVTSKVYLPAKDARILLLFRNYV